MITSILFACLTLTSPSIQDGTSLSKIDFLTQNHVQWIEEGFSIRDRPFHFRLTRDSYEEWPVFAVFDLNRGFGLLKATCGIPDRYTKENLKRKSWFRIYLDGEVAMKGEFGKDKFLQAISLDTTGASSLRIELDNCVLADPTLYIGSPKPIETAPRILEPSNGQSVSGTTTLRWSTVEDATAYGLRLTITSLDGEDNGSDRIFSYTVRNRHSFDLNTKTLPAGSYSWAVIAFADKKTLGDYSAEKSFRITR